MRTAIVLFVVLLAWPVARAASPNTTTAPTTLLNTQCSSSQALFGTGTGTPPACQAITLPLLPSIGANTTLGNATSGTTTPSALSMPSCSGSTNALTWTTSTGWGCNTITTGAAGTLNLATYPGVTVGSGQTLSVRQANCTNINGAITYAESNGLELVVPDGIYEISCSGGIVIPYVAGGFQWRGSRSGSVFVQYYATTPGGPVITMGDITGTNQFNGFDFDGATFKYGASQSGYTSAETVQIGAMTNSRINGLTVGAPSNANPGYDGVLFNNGSNLNYSANSASDWSINGAQRTLINAANALGAGNTFGNIFASNGASPSTYGALTGYCLTLGTTQSTEPKFTGLNCQWISGNIIVDLESTVGAVIDNLHLEGIKSTGASPILVQTSAATVNVVAMQVKNWLLQTANVSGTPKVLRDASATPSNVQVGTLNFLNTVSGNVTTPFTVVSPDAPANDNGEFAIGQTDFLDTAGTTFATNVNFDSHMPTSSSAFLTPERTGRYTWGVFGSVLEKSVVPVSATYTHYGELTGATLNVPASITSFTITLAATQGASGNAPVALGTTVKVARQSGSASGTLTVQDDVGNVLATSTTAATYYWFIFNGTHFVTFTPVT